MKEYTIHSEQLIDHDLDVVFAFFADARNLEQITPPFLNFEITTQGPTEMAAGTLIDYRLRLRGIPVRWQSKITVWKPMRRFVDEQRRGPYRYWIHEHLFEPVDGGTLVKDNVVYAVPGGSLVHKLLVAPDLRRIWEYRREQLNKLFAVDTVKV